MSEIVKSIYGRCREAGYALELYWLLTLIKVRLKYWGFKRTVHKSTQLKKPIRRQLSRAEEVEFIHLTKRLGQQVCRWHLFPNRCLEQALLFSWFLARRGFETSFIIAVRKYPFEAHAWTKWRDIELSEVPPTNFQHFKPILELWGASTLQTSITSMNKIQFRSKS